jgi:hypothetical protein
MPNDKKWASTSTIKNLTQTAYFHLCALLIKAVHAYQKLEKTEKAINHERVIA